MSILFTKLVFTITQTKQASQTKCYFASIRKSAVIANTARWIFKELTSFFFNSLNILKDIQIIMWLSGILINFRFPASLLK